MSDWKRKTQEVSFENLLPEMIATINNHIEQYNLGPILSDAIMCIQTISEKTKKGLFKKEETMYTGAVITPRWLVWSTSGIKMQTVVLSARLNDIVVQDYAQTQFAKMIPDSGLQITGKFTERSENISAFIGADDELAGKKFKETVIQTVQDAKK
jgi:hypothetical protein